MLFAWLCIAALAAVAYGRSGWLILGGYVGLMALIAVVVIPVVGRVHAAVVW
jgi:hypothetical protein